MANVVRDAAIICRFLAKSVFVAVAVFSDCGGWACLGRTLLSDEGCRCRFVFVVC